jgi:hypothetical protein
MSEPDVRETLDRLIREKGEDYSSLSKLLGRNSAYIQQFIRRGVPRKLDEADRRTLARYFGVSESLLGGLDAGRDGPAEADRNSRTATPLLVEVPQLDVGASAGPGALNSDERAVGRIGFQPSWLRELAPTSVANLSLIRVDGTSMAPTLNPGDDILVDLGDAAERLRDGIYVLRLGDELNVKRLAVFPQGRRFTIKSDNDQYPDWTDCTPETVTVVGRVLWAGRRM